MNIKSPHAIIPVLSSSDIIRDLAWYKKHVGFEPVFNQDGYAGIQRGDMEIHLQFHLGTAEDPVHGSVIKIFVEDINVELEDMVERGSITYESLQKSTPWKTHEFSFFDPNKNAIYFVQDV